MGSCAGSPQGSWTPASGSLESQHLVEPASWCECGCGPPVYPSTPHTGVSRDPQGCPRSATWICGARPGPRRPHPAVRGLAQPGTRIQGWPGPWGLIPLVLELGLVGTQINPTPKSLGPSQPRSLWVRGWCPVQVCHPPGQTVGGGRAQCILCTTHLHPAFRGSLPSLLPATSGFSIGQSGF